MSFTYKATQSQKTLKDGSRTINIRITKDRKTAYINTGVRIADVHWNPKGNSDKANWIRSSHVMHGVFNQNILDAINKCQKEATEEMSVDDLKREFEGKNENKIGFFAFSAQCIELKKATKSAATIENYSHRIKIFKTFLGDKEIIMGRLTYELIRKYESYLFTQGYAETTVGGNLMVLKLIIREAIKSKLMKFEENPFLVMQINKGRGAKVRLDIDEIRKIEGMKLTMAYGQKHFYIARGVFLTQFYCAGARISDVLLMRFESLIEDRWIYKTRKSGKREKVVSVKLSPKAIILLQKFGYGKKTTGYVFPFLKEVEYSKEGLHKKIKSAISGINKNLRGIGKELGIQKNISTHIARHSYANIARQNSDDLYAISKSLNHSTLAITQDYFDSCDNNAVDKVIDIMANV